MCWCEDLLRHRKIPCWRFRKETSAVRLWRFPQMGDPKPPWVSILKRSSLGWFGGTPILGNLHVCIYIWAWAKTYCYILFHIRLGSRHPLTIYDLTDTSLAQVTGPSVLLGLGRRPQDLLASIQVGKLLLWFIQMRSFFWWWYQGLGWWI